MPHSPRSTGLPILASWRRVSKAVARGHVAGEVAALHLERRVVAPPVRVADLVPHGGELLVAPAFFVAGAHPGERVDALAHGRLDRASPCRRRRPSPSGGKTFSTKTWPSASPRSRVGPAHAALPARRELLRPAQRAPRRRRSWPSGRGSRGRAPRRGRGASAGRSSRRRAAPCASCRSSSAKKAGSVTLSQARGRRAGGGQVVVPAEGGVEPASQRRRVAVWCQIFVRVALLHPGERRPGERGLDAHHRPRALGGLRLRDAGEARAPPPRGPGRPCGSPSSGRRPSGSSRDRAGRGRRPTPRPPPRPSSRRTARSRSRRACRRPTVEVEPGHEPRQVGLRPQRRRWRRGRRRWASRRPPRPPSRPCRRRSSRPPCARRASARASGFAAAVSSSPQRNWRFSVAVFP